MTDSISRTFETAEGVAIAYRLFGKPGRTPIVIVHGLSYFSYDWIEPGTALAADRQVAAMDMRGFGDSGPARDKDYTIPAFARDIVALLDHLGWHRVILIGHSMGGRNSTYCAAENPGRFAGLVLVDWSPELAPAGSQRVTKTVAGVPEVFATVDDAMRYFGADTDSPQGDKRARFEAYLRPVPGGFAIKRVLHFRDQFRKVLETGERPKQTIDLWATVAKVACPILVIRGTRSDLFAPATAPKMTAANARVTLVEVDAGHNVAEENRADFLSATRAFLARGDLSHG
ncbi:MAG: alpha/beta hydrolase [Proteobacteria bacterium]|nr:alpha/beta hydrolase [Pseudomonadota bacterium]